MTPLNFFRRQSGNKEVNNRNKTKLGTTSSTATTGAPTAGSRTPRTSSSTGNGNKDTGSTKATAARVGSKREIATQKSKENAEKLGLGRDQRAVGAGVRPLSKETVLLNGMRKRDDEK